MSECDTLGIIERYARNPAKVNNIYAFYKLFRKVQRNLELDVATRPGLAHSKNAEIQNFILGVSAPQPVPEPANDKDSLAYRLGHMNSLSVEDRKRLYIDS